MTHDLAVSSLDMVNGPMEVVGEWVSLPRRLSATLNMDNSRYP